MNDVVTYHRPVLPLGGGAASPELLFVGQAGDLPLHLRGALHRHTHYELMLLRSGRADFFCDFQLYPLQAPTLTFVAPGQLHAWSGDWETFGLIVASFTPALFAVHGQDRVGWSSCPSTARGRGRCFPSTPPTPRCSRRCSPPCSRASAATARRRPGSRRCM